MLNRVEDIFVEGKMSPVFLTPDQFPEYGEWSEYACIKGHQGCFCAVGFSYNDCCVECRDKRLDYDVFSRCICPPKDNTCINDGEIEKGAEKNA